jgi:pyruvate kinase
MMKKRTKIVCTIGPACEDREILTKMVMAGMNVARLNFSHGTHENHAELIASIRAVAEETGRPVAIMQDLQGPKIRLGILPEVGIELVEGGTVTFDTAIDEFVDGVIPIGYKDLHTHLKVGERILLSDGKIEVSVLSIESTIISTKVVVGGTVFSHKGINVPDSVLDIAVLTDKDKDDVLFGVLQGVDLIALSFVMRPSDIIDLRYLIGQYEDENEITKDAPIRLIAKIERREAVDSIDDILDVVDGIMVARGDLGIEIPAFDVPIVQKKLIDHALRKAKPVIVATQMLDSMQNNPRPTRAEVSDVANAVIDHTDAVMLSNETATGKYPVVTVETMADIIAETEKSHYDDMELRTFIDNKDDTDGVVSEISRIMAERLGAKFILAASISGDTGRMISRHRPELSIMVATSSSRVERQLNLSWGVYPFVLPECRTIEELIERSISYLKENKQAKIGDKIIVVAGEPVGESGQMNLLEVREVR